jgi:hypothetical protein
VLDLMALILDLRKRLTHDAGVTSGPPCVAEKGWRRRFIPGADRTRAQQVPGSKRKKRANMFAERLWEISSHGVCSTPSN